MRTLIFTLLVLWRGLMLGQGANCDQLQAGFTAFVNGTTVLFSNTSLGTGDGTQCFWSFGDGTNAQGTQVPQTYILPGTYEVCMTVVTILVDTNGQALTCQDAYCAPVTVFNGGPCSPNFVVEMDAQQQGNGLVTFVATSTIPSTNFIWYFGDGTQANGASANHTYAQDGTYGVCVTGWYFNEATQDTCWIEDCEPVVVSGTPCNGLEACFVTNDLGDGMYFFDNCSSQGGNAQYFWDFGDGSSSTVVNAEHLYELPGVYSVCLVVYEGNCVDSTCTNISIAGPCNSLAANFGWSLAGGQAEFDNVTVPVGLSTTWSWNFGDGSTSTENSPSHFYTAPGTYQACLTAISILEGGFTCTDTYCVTVVVQNSVPCQGFEACFEAFPVDGIMLFENCSTPTNGQYFWDFGDGQSATGPNASHTYAPGTYTACLSAYWGVCADTTCTTFTVVGENPCQTLQADFGAFTQGQTVSFLNSSFGTGIQSSYIWAFGDGQHSTEFSPQHTYAQAGTYEACLIITSLFATSTGTISCQDTYCTVITVGNSGPCDPGFAVELAWNAGPDNQVFLTGTSNRPDTYFIWYLGDGSEAYGPSVTHTYAEDGTYTVCLAGYTIDPLTSDSCWVEDCAIITVGGDNPCDALNAEFTPVVGGLGVNLQNAVVNNTWTYLWDFGDGNQGYGPNTGHQYNAPGVYTICLSVYTWDPVAQDTCFLHYCEPIIIGGLPCSPNFIVEMDAQPQGNGLVTFVATSTIPNTNFIWYFGDGAQAFGPTADHVYAQTGTYGVCVTGWYFNEATQDTCWIEDCEPVIVGNGNPCDALNAEFTPFVGGFGVNIQNAVINSTWTYLWSFGDGTQGYGPNAGHQYNAPGVYDICLTVYTWDPVAQDTCFAYHCEVITIGDTPCDPDFAVELAWNAGPNNTVFLSGGSNVPETYFIWYLGDGSEAYGPSVTHTYAQPGTYTVCMAGWYNNIVTGDSCWTEDCAVITVGGGNPCDSLQACFVTNELGNGGFFFDNCTGGPLGTQYFWTFGDGTTSSGTNVDHQYSEPGTYEVCLTAFWQQCADTTCTTVTVFGDDPCAQLSAGYEYFANGLAIQFVSATAGASPQSTFTWSFGDGATGSGPNPMHDYVLPGTYEVCLHVESIYAFPGQPVVVCEDEICSSVTVAIGGPCDQHQAAYTSTPVGLLTQQFVSTSLGTTENTEYFWTFGDGSTAGGPDPSHTYAAMGVYEVCLRIQTVFEAFPGWPVSFCTDSICYTVDVGFFDPCSGLEACFAPLPFENGAYLFENCSQLLPLGIPASYFWDFGDGSTSTDASPAHSFGPGIYTVCLTVTHGDCVDSTCTTITVNSGGECDPNYSASFTYEVQNNAVIFLANEVTPTIGVVWTFPDGTQAYEWVHTHLFEPPGPFEVCLSTWYWNELTQDTCWAHTCQWIDPFKTVNSVGDLNDSAISVFPVPAHDQLTITGLPARATLQLFSPDGRLVRSAQPNSDTHRLPVQDLATGTYLLLVEASGERAYRRVVVE
ncbi:MAG: PKD domain-containing protein [Flavobacteriales bacterium]|nr:PKD domain-containing protein [Flavobacteriales bacterium]